jgi:ABC-type sugar transport system permease subunit
MTVAGPIGEAVDEEALAPAPVQRNKIKTGEGKFALTLVAPTIAILVLVVGYPIIKGIWSSLHSFGGGKIDPKTGFLEKGGQWSGLTNYKHWLLEQCGNTTCPNGNLGSQFWASIQTTLLFAVVTVVLETVIGMGFALVMNKEFAGRGIVRAAILIPWAIPTAVTTKMWVVIFQPNGIINKVLHIHVLWTTSSGAQRSAIILADTWKTTPFIALLLLAGLQNISADIYESARMDGANAWQRFTKITLPLIRPALAVAVIFRALDALRMYDLPQIFAGGSNGTTTISILDVKELTSNPNSASALSTIAFIFIFAIALSMVKLFNANIGGKAAGLK